MGLTRAGPAGGWAAFCASETGASHRLHDAANEDAVAAAELPGAAGVVVAVADGHGSSRHPFSAVGAALAVEVACATVVELLPPALTRRDADLAATAALVARTLVEAWTDAVRRHAAAERPAASGAATDLVAYGSTVLAAACWPTGVLLWQLGDGDVLVVGRDGSVRESVAADPRSVGDTTASLCHPGAAGEVRTAQLSDVDDLGLLLLASDGYGNSFADGNWRPTVAKDLTDLIAAAGQERVAASLPTWLAESALAAGDDTSAALVVRDVRGSPSHRV